MKNLLALALLLMVTSAQAINIERGNTMSAEAAPRKHETNSSVTDTNRRINDSISTGQAATTRRTTTPTVSRCVDRSGYSYYKNDSGYASCVNQSSSHSFSK